MKNQIVLQNLADFGNKSLLIVDDDNPFRERLARAMEKKGFEVFQAEGVKKGIDSVKIKKPGFAVVDLRLGDGNGLEDGDILGNIIFDGGDVAGQFEGYASIVASVVEADNGDEAGQVAIQVANDGTPRNGIVVTADKATAEEVDVTIANGVASTTTIAGGLLVNGSNNIFTSATSAKPAVKLTNSNTDALGPEIIFEKTATGIFWAWEHFHDHPMGLRPSL